MALNSHECVGNSQNSKNKLKELKKNLALSMNIIWQQLCVYVLKAGCMNIINNGFESPF